MLVYVHLCICMYMSICVCDARVSGYAVYPEGGIGYLNVVIF